MLVFAVQSRHWLVIPAIVLVIRKRNHSPCGARARRQRVRHVCPEAAHYKGEAEEGHRGLDQAWRGDTAGGCKPASAQPAVLSASTGASEYHLLGTRRRRAPGDSQVAAGDDQPRHCRDRSCAGLPRSEQLQPRLHAMVEHVSEGLPRQLSFTRHFEGLGFTIDTSGTPIFAVRCCWRAFCLLRETS
jgi:hypothetical protein